MIFTQMRRMSYKKVRTWYAGLVKPKPADPPYGHIVQIGDPTLRSATDEIPVSLIKSSEIKFVIERMKEVFTKFNCVGLSAPQIGIGVKIILVEFNEKHAKAFSKEERRIKEMTLLPFAAFYLFILDSMNGRSMKYVGGPGLCYTGRVIDMGKLDCTFAIDDIEMNQMALQTGGQNAVVINPEIKVTDYSKITFPEACESVKGLYADVTRYKGVKLKGYSEQGDLFEIEARGWPARIIQHEVDHLNGKIYTDIMEPKSLTCTCWEVVNERRGKVELPYGVY